MKIPRPTINVDLENTRRLDAWIAERLPARETDRDRTLPYGIRFSVLWESRVWAMGQRRRFWNKLRAIAYRNQEEV